VVARPVKKDYGRVQVIKHIDLDKILSDFARNAVYVGIAADSKGNARSEGDMTNARLGWIHETGAEGVPPRPFLKPTIRQESGMIAKRLGLAMKKAMDGHPATGEKVLEGLALTVPTKVKDYIRDSSHFKPLSPATIAARHELRGTAQHWSEDPTRPGFSVTNAQPLINTAQMLNSIDGFVEKD